MNLGSICVLVLLLGLVALALWRVHKKGTPCLCDGKCSGGCGACQSKDNVYGSHCFID